jgi:ribonuclease P protein component
MVRGGILDFRFPANFRLRHKLDFERTYRQRVSASDGNLLVFGAANGLPHCRLGLSVSRKVGGAVLRNRWKRLIREAFRTSYARLPEGLDLIVIPRKKGSPELCQIRESLAALVRISRRLARYKTK